MSALPRAWIVSLALAMVFSGCATGGDPELAAARTRIGELEQENTELREQIAAIVSALGDDFTRPPSVLPKIDVSVLSVDRGVNRVVLNKGKTDGVRLDYTLDVYCGSKYRGQIRITEVRDGTSTAVILSEKNPIVPGDSATTQL